MLGQLYVLLMAWLFTLCTDRHDYCDTTGIPLGMLTYWRWDCIFAEEDSLNLYVVIVFCYWLL